MGLPGKVKQATLADMLDVHRNTVQAWEADTSTPGGENIVQLAHALGVTPAYLVDGGENAYRKAFDEIAAIVDRVRRQATEAAGASPLEELRPRVEGNRGGDGEPPAQTA